MTFNTPIDTEREGAEFAPVPAGIYNAQIVRTEDKPTQKGGTQTSYEFNIIDGASKGRRIFANFNVICPGSEKAEKIARQDIARLAQACGLTNVRDTNELVFKSCAIRVDIEPEHDGYKAKNIITGYQPATVQAPATTAQPTCGSPAPKTATPWG